MTELASIVDEETEEAHDGIAATRLVAGENMNILHARFEPGASNVRHSHPHEQIVFVFRGTITQHVGDEVIEMDAGDALLIPGGTPHDSENRSDEPVELVEIFSPPKLHSGGTPEE